MTNVDFVDRTIAQLEALPKTFRAFVLRIRRGGELIDAQPSMVLRAGDVVAVAAPLPSVHGARRQDRPRGEDRALLDIPIESLDVVVTSRVVAGQTLAELASQDFARSVFLRKLVRAGEEMPTVPDSARRPG